MKWFKELKMLHPHLGVIRQVVSAFKHSTRSINGENIWFNQEKKILLTITRIAIKNFPT